MPETERLSLRQWRDTDLEPFAQLNGDPQAMRYFPNTLSRAASDALADKARQLIDANRWGMWAAEIKASAEFIGFVGLHALADKMPFAPCVEIGWRLLPQFWGHGYATEGAVAALDYAFNTLELEQVVAFTAVSNAPSRAVMARLGMTNSGRNFLHPDIDPEHPLAEHVLYTIDSSQWQAKPKSTIA